MKPREGWNASRTSSNPLGIVPEEDDNFSIHYQTILIILAVVVVVFPRLLFLDFLGCHLHYLSLSLPLSLSLFTHTHIYIYINFKELAKRDNIPFELGIHPRFVDINSYHECNIKAKCINEVKF